MSISDLQPGTPVDADYIGEGAEKIRLINDALVEAFGAVAGAITNGSGVGDNPPSHIDFSNLFTRLEAVEEQTGAIGGQLLPAGAIILWSGSVANIPDGWALCDGSLGTPNLSEKFVMGRSSSFPEGSSGGSLVTAGGGAGSAAVNIADHVLRIENLPAHQHKVFSSSAGAPPSPGSDLGPNDVAALEAGVPEDFDQSYAIMKQQNATGEASVGLTSTVGQQTPVGVSHGSATVNVEAHTHGYQPPFFSLCYIMKLAA